MLRGESPPFHHAASFSSEWIEQRGKRGKSLVEKFRRLAETRAGTVWEERTSSTSSFSFLRSISALGSLPTRLEEKSLRVFCGHLHRVFTFSRPFCHHIKAFHLCALKGISRMWVADARQFRCFMKNQLTTFILTRNRLKKYIVMYFFLHFLAIQDLTK